MLSSLASICEKYPIASVSACFSPIDTLAASLARRPMDVSSATFRSSSTRVVYPRSASSHPLIIVPHASSSFSRDTGSEMSPHASARKIASNKNASSPFKLSRRMKMRNSGSGSSNALSTKLGASFSPPTSNTSILSKQLRSDSGIAIGPNTYPVNKTRRHSNCPYNH